MTNKKRWALNLSLASVSFLGSLFFINKSNKTEHTKEIPKFFSGQAPYIFAHRGGMAVRPEQTQLAFDNAVAYNLDGFETDVRLTKDEKLIVFHDATVDRTTNGSGKVSDHSVAELKRLDAGYHFKDINGLFPYRGHNEAKILTFDELLKMYPNMYINVDLKDAPDSYEGTVAPTKMYEDIINNNAQDRVLVTSFYKEQNDRFRKISNGQVAIGASQKEVAEGFIKFNTGLGNTYQPVADTFQMPIQFKGIPLTSKRFIQWLNVLNIVPGFYGINSTDLMVDLYRKGVHTLVTDRPDLGQQFKASLQSNK
ncbi:MULTISPECIES: glycerophosphodiester phosphodiesterase [unclassified Staphylococcus]|uniref:glycerophosphodiester phosphodiesterase n=1 Tax=unclassified Staphylococcus TaxID=91994 RepID=UPI0009469725|nr:MULTISPECIES: glycerophosphodiester phosphodiesterase [unclassified Staphylococcus]MBF2756883.1 glycerophosphodiester phosphodiesterase [Staphylococcus haemolyticus]OLF31498.1 glycerophosphodiester phosphodiesterase [Staphylococcus aureus]MBF2772938.1 glycerophosphodiester phosphodiesterase [Staphylococcus haemolyticus]MBF2775446.1 glycerophosphodiester phosphodiesterase [Staphylococcus haemolyticus]MBF2814747.1 glycerophosphodiester phosphodiesterase [Staphylococcus haemolyticus]